MAVLLGTASLWARPALKGTVTVSQPDGTTLSLRLVGDEYLHFNTTADGYTVVKNADGIYVYAQKADGRLQPTAMKAHDEGQRTVAEQAYLSTVGKRLTPDMSSVAKQMRSQNRAAQARTLSQMRAGRYDYSKFKGLILLVEYNDASFRYDDYKDIMEAMVNQENYTGEARTNISAVARLGIPASTCTGSIRDFYSDNSMGQFQPTFDIVGPVQVNRSQYYPNAGSSDNENYRRGTQLMIDACTAADDLVDFSDYDVDGDGLVDMVYFIFAGLPSYIEGNDKRLLWPHQSDMRSGRWSSQYARLDGVTLGRYACSTELFGYEAYNWSVLEGIGTICHEFTHVLGLPDFYDADYTDSGGQSDDVGEWSVMANGADYNNGRTPCAFSLFERYALGFAKPQVISEVGELELEDVKSSNAGYRLNTPVSKEFFMLENRQQTKWDAKLPGHGMLIFRVDSTSASIWQNNAVNNNPNHMYYELVRAKGVKKSNGVAYAAASDPFPGTGRVREINNTTTPASLLTWAKKNNTYGLRNIVESDGKITFEVYEVNVLTEIKMQATATLGVGTTLQLTTELVPEDVTTQLAWASDNEGVATVSQDGLVTGVAAGKATVTVTATNGVTASCEVTVEEIAVAENIAAFRAMADGDAAMLQLDDAQVLYIHNNDIYVRDASGAIILSGIGLNVKRNDMLNGVVYGELKHENLMPMMVSVEGAAQNTSVVSTGGEEAQPIEVTASQLGERYYCEMITVKRATVVKDNGYWMAEGEQTARLFNKFQIKNPKIEVPTDLTKRYDITAIYGTDLLNGEPINEVYLLKSPQEASAVKATTIAMSASQTIVEGETLQLVLDIVPADAEVALTWTTSDASVATVDAEGMVTAIAEGETTITVTDSESGLMAQCDVTVAKDPTVIGSVAVNAAANGYYSLDGRRLSAEPAHGVFLVRQNGRVVKRMR